LDGFGLASLRRAIFAVAWGRDGTGEAAPMLPRHRRAMLAALHHIQEGRALVAPAERTLLQPELIAQRMRLALDSAGELVGRMPPDEIIGRIFATFCIGK
jgi:tRNA modification GTPase